MARRPKMPATKQDAAWLKKDMSALKKDVTGLKKDVGDLKDDVTGLKKGVADLRTEMKAYADDIKRHFDMTVETIRHDLLGANRDELMKDRITRLERHAGLVAS